MDGRRGERGTENGEQKTQTPTQVSQRKIRTGWMNKWMDGGL